MSEIKISISAEGELCIYRNEPDGVYMLIIDEDAPVTYSFISRKAGQYDSLHRTEETPLKDLLEKFLPKVPPKTSPQE